MLRRFSTITAAFCLAVTGRAVPPPQVGLLEVPPTARYGTIRLLDGLPVAPIIAVGFGANPLADTAPIPTGSVEERFRAAATTVSTPFVPFGVQQVRGVWVIAPTVREDLRPNLRSLSPNQMTSRGELLRSFVSKLNPEQVKEMGTPRGLHVTALSPEVSGLIVQALHDPLGVVETKPPASRKRYAWPPYEAEETLLWTAPPMPLSVRAYLRVSKLTLERQTDNASLQSQIVNLDRQFGREFSEVTRPLIPGNGPLDYAVLRVIPNTAKASDLSGVRFTSALGMRGVYHLEDVIAEIAKRTGLKLSCSAGFVGMPVLIGSPSISCGEAMDAVCLAVTGAWRKIGDRYLLVWDRRGLAAMERTALEQTAKAAGSVLDTQRMIAINQSWPAGALAQLPFEAADPLALTAEQIQTLSQQPPSRTGYPVIGWEQMTPTQQAEVRRVVSARNAQAAPENRGIDTSTPWRRINDDDLPRITIDDKLEVVLSVMVEGTGWVLVPPEWPAIMVSVPGAHTSTLQLMNPRIGASPAIPPPAGDSPVSVDIPNLCVKVGDPVTARLKTLALAMKARGFTTLYYPILLDGCATFPSKAFPLHPSLHGSNGLAAAVGAMKPLGIRVIGYLNTLTWRPATGTPHWLDAHRAWIDVDALGRTRSEWVKLGRPGAVTPASSAGAEHDYVRPLEPAVRSRLHQLISELAHSPGLAGIAFSEWEPQSTEYMFQGYAPPLGYAVPERLDRLAYTGSDPQDVGTGYSPYTPLLFSRRWSQSSEYRWDTYVGRERGASAWYTFLTELLEAAREANPHWQTHVFTADKNTPKADVVIGGAAYGALTQGTIWGVPSRPGRISKGNPFEYLANALSRSRRYNRTLDTVVVDLGSSGVDTLKWFAPVTK